MPFSCTYQSAKSAILVLYLAAHSVDYLNSMANQYTMKINFITFFAALSHSSNKKFHISMFFNGNIYYEWKRLFFSLSFSCTLANTHTQANYLWCIVCAFVELLQFQWLLLCSSFLLFFGFFSGPVVWLSYFCERHFQQRNWQLLCEKCRRNIDSVHFGLVFGFVSI